MQLFFISEKTKRTHIIMGAGRDSLCKSRLNGALGKGFEADHAHGDFCINCKAILTRTLAAVKGSMPPAPRGPMAARPVQKKIIHEPSTAEQIRFVDRFFAADSIPLFLTGKAGTGKSSLLDFIQSKNVPGMVVLATTGIAALNVGGQTIHSFFGLPPEFIDPRNAILGKDAKKRLDAAKIIVVDEISMCRADTMDVMDQLLRRAKGKQVPFGGVKMVFVGDPLQLPPVIKSDEMEVLMGWGYASENFFDAKVFGAVPIEMHSLSVNFRQKDERFMNALNSIRRATEVPRAVDFLNAECAKTPIDGAIHLVGTNAKADQINEEHLQVLPARAKTFRGQVVGRFSVKSCSTPEVLTLKVGARVIATSNVGEAKNGSLGTVESIADDEVLVRFDGIGHQRMSKLLFTQNEYVFDEATKALVKKEIGSMLQFPLRLGWAITIHKSQGQTYQSVNIDLGWGAFATGQTYVALSRCTTLEGMSIAKPIRPKDVFVSDRAVQFLERSTEVSGFLL